MVQAGFGSVTAVGAPIKQIVLARPTVDKRISSAVVFAAPNTRAVWLLFVAPDS